MSTKSEIGIIAAVDGDAATARWRASQPSSEAQILPPLQVQSLPGNQVNSLFALALGPDGAWYIGDDDRVYYAPYQTGVFAPILTMPVYRSDSIVRVAVPGHLVIHHVGTRWVSIVSLQYGLILEQELPALPTGSDPDTRMAGVVYEGDSADRIAIMFQSLDGDLRGYSYTTMESPGALFGVMPHIDVLAYSGMEHLWQPHALIALAARAYQLPDIRGFFAGGTSGRASPAGVYSYEFTTPAPEVNPGLGVQDYGVTASPTSSITWEPSGASATLYMDTVVMGSGYKWDSFPVPVTVGSTLTIRIEPVLLGTTHGTINIGGVAYPLRATNNELSNHTTFYSDLIRLNDMLLAAGGTYPVSLSIFTSSSGSRTTPITLVSGGDPDRSGFRVGEFGSVSTTNVFQEGGVVRRLVSLESNRTNVNRELWSGGLVWLMPPSRPPFWTGFVRTVEDIDAGTTPDPGPDPDPDPGQDVVFDTTVTIGDIGDSWRGFDGWGEAGDIDPYYFTVGEAEVEVDLLAFAPSELLYPESPGRTMVAVVIYCGGADPDDVSLESASLAFNGLIVEIERNAEMTTESTVGLAGLLPESSGNWLPDFDDQLPVTLTLQGFDFPGTEPEEPYEPVGDPIAIAIEAAGEDSPVGFSFGFNTRGSVEPSTIEYEGRTLTIVTADMYNYGDGDVSLFFELIGDVTGLAFAGSGFSIGGVLVGAEAGNYDSSVQFWAWHEDLQPWQDGETYLITFYPGQEG